MNNDWPKVQPDDDGIRPGGPPDECFYCHRKVGQTHGRNCVMITKRVRMRYEIEIEIDVPHYWNKESIEFHRGESSWCADNVIGDIQAFVEQQNQNGSCLCPHFSATFLEVADYTPQAKGGKW